MKLVVLAAIAGLCFAVSAPKAQAQVSVSIGVEPVCPYGYFDYPPYACAPYGYYGPEWFQGGVFIGAGPWFHGPAHFRGHVDEHFDPHHGYHGHLPSRGGKADWGSHHGTVEHFKGHAVREEHGHADKH
ncbi:MAG: hypothetical protein WAM85_22035 [Terracidiphilus sp.]